MKKKKTPGKMSSERMSADIARLLENQNCKSEAELAAFVDSIAGGSIPEAVAVTPLDKAQELIYDAWETEGVKERIKMAKEALTISPDCADAYNLLAEEEAKGPEEARDLYRKGIEAGKRALGEEFFSKNFGCCWGYVRARPYMRSRSGYMQCLWMLGKQDEAVKQAKKMLRLNSDDNQGIRYLLIAYMAEMGRYDELEKFMGRRHFCGDCAPEWLYARALLAFVRHGSSETSARELKTALKGNQFVPEYLTGEKAIPRELPYTITSGGEDEAYCCAARQIKAWRKVPGALSWLKEQTGLHSVPQGEHAAGRKRTMENIEMKLSFTRDEMQKLILMTAIGSWVINGIREKCLEDFESVEQGLFHAAMKQGLHDLFEREDLVPDIFPNKSIEKLMMKYVDEYNEYTFWEELEDRLIDRDMLKKYGPDEFKKMTFEERIDNEEEFREKYAREFTENGLENIEVAKKQA